MCGNEYAVIFSMRRYVKKQAATGDFREDFCDSLRKSLNILTRGNTGDFITEKVSDVIALT